MGRMYAVTFEDVAVAALQDLCEFQPADDKPVRIAAIYLSQHSAEGDANEDYWRIKIIRGHATSGSGGSAATPRPLDPHDAAAGATCEVNNTTIASTGTPVDLHAESFNIRAGLAFVPPPDQRPKATQADTTLVVRLMANPDASTQASGTIVFEEL